MSGRRGRPRTRHLTAPEPGPKLATNLPARQTRRNTKRTEAPIEEMPAKRATRSAGVIDDAATRAGPSPIAQRGTRRQRRRSLESIATGDFNPEDEVLDSESKEVAGEEESDVESELEPDEAVAEKEPEGKPPSATRSL
ncbi:hypothetical protein SLS62_007655 [Diatrype stigma]|uniref:Uncharacterized protein n=1 Tax=Diatrype stigma TaxID=117547 RepID=A0AAN9ULL4_9PEZI